MSGPIVTGAAVAELARACRDDMLAYFTFVDPNYRPNRFHRYLAQRLAPILARGHGRVIISAPPQHGKSEFISRKLPAYALGRYPTWNVIAATYGDDLTQLNGAAVRDILQSPQHAMVFPEVRIGPESRAAMDFFTTTGGGRYYGTTVKGGATGFGAKLFIIDDPYKDRTEADSPTVRRHVQDGWFKPVVYTRLAQDSILIVMHTRWHESDLTGWALEELKHEGWEVINLPALAEENDLMGRKPGEALVPERYDEQALARICQTMGGAASRDWTALYCGRPRPDGGGEFKEQWIQTYTDVRQGLGMNKIILVDPSSGRRGKEAQENDNSAFWCIGLGFDENFYVLDYVRDKLDLAQRTDLLFAWHRKWKPNHAVRYEHYGMQADIEHIQGEMERRQYRFKIKSVGGGVDKLNRIRRMVPAFSTGRFYFPQHIWYTNHTGKLIDLRHEFVEQEFKPFPVGRWYDSMDALARLFEPNPDKDPDLVLKWPSAPPVVPIAAPFVPIDAQAGY